MRSYIEPKQPQAHTPTPATREMVRSAGFAHIKIELLLTQLKISRPTFDKYYRQIHELGRLEAVRAVNSKFLERALQGSDTLLLHATKTIGGLSEKLEHEVKADININLSWLSNRDVTGSKQAEIVDCDQVREIEDPATLIDNASTADIQADSKSGGNLHTPTVEILVGKRIVKRRTPEEIKRVKGLKATWAAKSTAKKVGTQSTPADKAKKAESAATPVSTKPKKATAPADKAQSGDVPKKQATRKKSSDGVGAMQPGGRGVVLKGEAPVKNSKK